MRSKREISGFILVDCCKACFCPCCVLTQMVRQVREDAAAQAQADESESEDESEDDEDESDDSD